MGIRLGMRLLLHGDKTGDEATILQYNKRW